MNGEQKWLLRMWALILLGDPAIWAAIIVAVVGILK
jgi:hypothetical protein